MLRTFRVDQPNVFTMRGPRQVGKSTTVKLLIQRVIHAGFPARRILYLSLELERQPRAIRDAVLRAKRYLQTQEEPWLIVLDELSWVRDWQSAILSLRDRGDASEDCLVLTGSSARDIRSGGERLPGRRPPRVPVESKYASRVNGNDRLTIRNVFQRGLIASRETLDLDDPVRVIPTSISLALLG